eukprot:CAMPEP_0185443086 /NCGR_PEP_ID=MMETSP1365-20130426/46416_1 /TAXON_ID=38817 /ORGANISM="Gephyrocapsa oceanica, Strain RCC1303" /LENGTH=64 /DNA_ID=CAMNT_0028048665 /DNA_START=65 /DNA_END=259 /DNA_ORIENTATION=-
MAVFSVHAAWPLPAATLATQPGDTEAFDCDPARRVCASSAPSGALPPPRRPATSKSAHRAHPAA